MEEYNVIVLGEAKFYESLSGGMNKIINDFVGKSIKNKLESLQTNVENCEEACQIVIKNLQLLSKDEKITVEYKTCQHGIQEDVYDTVCSFSNRYGGYIIMGVEDDGTPIGINPNLIKDMKKNFVNQLNNPSKMSPTLYLSIEDFEYEGMILLWVYVPPTATVETGYMTEMKMVIWILLIHRFSYRICTTERALHMRNIRFSHM